MVYRCPGKMANDPFPNVAARKREIKRWGWANILGWFKEWTFWGSPRRIRNG